MSGIERIKKYVDKTGMAVRSCYELYTDEITAIYEMSKYDPCGAICIAFKFGKAKGYRMAQ